MLRIMIEQYGTTRVMSCRGRIVAGHEVQMLESVAGVQTCERLLLNLANVDAIDARGLAGLIAIQWQCLNDGIEFAIVNPSARVYDLMRLVKLDGVVHTWLQPPRDNLRRHWAILAARDPDSVVELEVDGPPAPRQDSPAHGAA
jgi:anti-anti-sigma factor